MSSQRRGFLYGLAAYLLWGFFPLYFRALRPTGPVEVLAHRILWSAVCVGLVILLVRVWRRRREGGATGSRVVPDRRRLLGLFVAAVLIATNWGAFIAGVDTDRVVEVSLGYFITPLVTVLLGVFVLRERLRVAQAVALTIGATAVTVLTVDYGRLPYVAMTLAVSFGLYGLVKKQLRMPALDGLFVEASLLAAPAVAVLGWYAATERSTVGTVSGWHTALMLAAGAITAVPLLLFAGAANRVPLITLGILQYIAPVLQFALGVLVFTEPMPPARWVGFALVWLALAVFTADAVRRSRRRAVPVDSGTGVAMDPLRP